MINSSGLSKKKSMVMCMVVQQLRTGFDNFSYVVYSPVQKKAAIIDPGFDAAPSLDFISSKKLVLEYIVVTHHHADHSSEVKTIKKLFPSSQLVASKIDGDKLAIKPDVVVSDGSSLMIGDVRLDFLLTPGHTPGGICIIVDDNALLTGDTLFIGDCGRTDLPGGNPHDMFTTLQQKIMILPDELTVYPGHDYGDRPFDTLVNQKRTNKTLLAKTFQEFSAIP
jgi:hydroxyacylglutathione hydrolase